MATREVEILRAACCIAGLDGQVCESEERLLRELKERAGVGEASYQAMLERARTDDGYHEDVLGTLRAEPDAVVRLLVEVAKADGEISLNERAIIRHLAERIGIGADMIESLLA